MTPFKLSVCSPFILINDNTEKLCLKFFFFLSFSLNKPLFSFIFYNLIHALKVKKVLRFKSRT